MQAFYERVVGELVGDGRLSPSARVLVVCGADVDRAVFLKAGFANVTITNLDACTHGQVYAPFDAAIQDAEALSYADGEFDVTVVHAGLHHCRSPHRAHSAPGNTRRNLFRMRQPPRRR